MSRSSYRRWFVAIVGAAAVWRVAYVVLFKYGDELVGDQIYYSGQAVMIADGRGFADPAVPGSYAADHAPLTSLMIAPVSWENDNPVLLQRLLMAIYGVGVVAGVGLVARWLSDRRTSLIAASMAGIYANFWMNDGLVMAETLAALAIVGLLFVAYRYDLSRSTRDAALMGVGVAIAGLARSELLLLGIFLVLPMTLTGATAPDGKKQRLLHLVVAGAAAVTVISPWVIRNQIRFEESVTMSTQDGLTLIGTNCPAAFEGSGKGFWHLACAFDVPVPPESDKSEQSAIYREAAFDYLGDHVDQLPGVVAARLGRGLSVWKVEAMHFLNRGEGREMLPSRIGVWQFWVLVPLATYGLVRWPVRQRRLPMYSLLAMSLLTIAALYGIPRFRIAAEVALVICGAIGVAALTARRESAASGEPDVDQVTLDSNATS